MLPWALAVWSSLSLSLQIATVATLLTAVLGVGLATLLTWRRTPLPDVLDAIITSPMVLPPTVLGYYLLVAFGSSSAAGRAWEDLTGTTIVFTFTGAVIAATVGSLPLVVKAARNALEQIDPSIVDAARTLGAGPVRTFVRVRLPLAAPGIIAGVVLGFARSLGDFGATVMVVGARIDGVKPMSIRIYDDIQAGREAAAMKAALVMTAVALVLVLVANRLTRRVRVH